MIELNAIFSISNSLNYLLNKLSTNMDINQFIEILNHYNKTMEISLLRQLNNTI